MKIHSRMLFKRKLDLKQILVLCCVLELIIILFVYKYNITPKCANSDIIEKIYVECKLRHDVFKKKIDMCQEFLNSLEIDEDDNVMIDDDINLTMHLYSHDNHIIIVIEKQ